MAKKITTTTSDTKVKIVKKEFIEKFIDVKKYAVENSLQDNSDKPTSLLKAINHIESNYGIVDLYSIGEVVIARIRGEL